MGVVIDTNVFVQFERSNGGIDFTAWEAHGEANASDVTASEQLVGVHRANTEARRQKRLAFVEAVLAQFPVLDFTTPIARVHAELFAQLAQQGEMIGAHDLNRSRHSEVSRLCRNYDKHRGVFPNSVVADYRSTASLNLVQRHTR